MQKVVAGPERRSRRLDENEKLRVAYHEVGHALVAAHSEHADPVRAFLLASVSLLAHWLLLVLVALSLESL